MAARWYIIHVYSGFERKVMTSIREQAQQQGLQELFEEIIVPMEEVVEVKRGKKVNAERKFFPGYVLVKMDLNDETWHLVRNTAKVTGFLGAGGKPTPIPDAEAERVLHQMQEGIEHPRPLVTFISGDQVRVTDGPFSSFNGTVEEVDEVQGPAESGGVDLRPRDPGRARVLAGREAVASSVRERSGSGPPRRHRTNLREA